MMYGYVWAGKIKNSFCEHDVWTGWAGIIRNRRCGHDLRIVCAGKIKTSTTGVMMYGLCG